MLLKVLALAVLCIFATAMGDFRVLNGKLANPGQFPFLVYLGGCTGSIINSNTILTAAHCVTPNLVSQVVVGAVDGKRPGWGSAKFRVARVYYHPSYHGPPSGSDLAVVRLTSHIEYSSRIQPISLSWRSHPIGTSTVVAGYGRTNRNTYGTLLYAENHVRACRYARDAVCTGKQPNSPGPGDSGGPLFVRSNGHYLQIGVVSGPDGGDIAVFGNIYKYQSWLKKFV